MCIDSTYNFSPNMQLRCQCFEKVINNNGWESQNLRLGPIYFEITIVLKEENWGYHWHHPDVHTFLSLASSSQCWCLFWGNHTYKHGFAMIKKVNSIPTHCGVAYESVCSLARGHVIRVCHRCWERFDILTVWAY